MASNPLEWIITVADKVEADALAVFEADKTSYNEGRFDALSEFAATLGRLVAQLTKETPDVRRSVGMDSLDAVRGPADAGPVNHVGVDRVATPESLTPDAALLLKTGLEWGDRCYTTEEVRTIAQALRASLDREREMQKNRDWWETTGTWWADTCRKAWGERDAHANQCASAERELNELQRLKKGQP